MIKIQIQSDLHLEAPKGYDVFEVTPKAPYLALLGDIGCIAKDYDDYANFLFTQLRQFKVVFLVMGNHEPYHASWPQAKILIGKFNASVEAQKQGGAEELGSFVLLDRTRFDIDDGEDHITILGCTLFSDVPPESHEAVSFGLNDFYHIRDWDIEKHNKEHRRDVEWLESETQALEGSGRKVVIFTHYCPTEDPRAKDPRHGESAIRSGFATDLADNSAWRSDSVTIWAFGHTHWNCDFIDERGKRVYANQRGYYFRQTTGFDGTAVVEM
ncbi:Metallo-dependent phosphatase-like protein [Truncatella angustata]|uniref:Metallo-dependent phosphatase-like protein n=1 Tax=Truncatella angustata TaxID=152316 RepID=A0A9P8ZW88_9PEZI|nr:Metallo-dependent phosphatase-like protein [Truncatella angustata]KAH6652801.1 Metallo-dependent phosphatase-like protein [Truncatella angustata]KAH8204710.1 hypothetical protein TruAng_001185 [Truncatella angustata]